MLASNSICEYSPLYETYPEAAQHNLGELTAILRAWYANKDSDSVRIQNMRTREFTVGARLTEELIYGVQPEQRLQLTIGSTAVDGSSFSKGAYDIYTESHHVLAPGSTLIIERSDTYFSHEYRPPKPELYIGDFSIVLALSKVAATLKDDGQLAIVEHTEAENSSTSS